MSTLKYWWGYSVWIYRLVVEWGNGSLFLQYPIVIEMSRLWGHSWLSGHPKSQEGEVSAGMIGDPAVSLTWSRSSNTKAKMVSVLAHFLALVSCVPCGGGGGSSPATNPTAGKIVCRRGDQINCRMCFCVTGPPGLLSFSCDEAVCLSQLGPAS